MTHENSGWISVRQLPLAMDLSALLARLRAEGIACRVTEVAGWQELAVSDPQQVARVEQWLEAHARGQVLGADSATELAGNGLSRAPADSGIPLALQWRLFPVTLTTLALCALSFVALYLAPNWLTALTFTPFTGRGYLSLEASLQAGEYWRLVSPIFLHFGVLHLIFNGVLLWWMGQRLEFALGSAKFLALIVLGALVSNYVQYAWSGHSNFGGISGVVYAFVGFILLNQRITPIAAFGGLDAMLWFMVAWLVLGMTGIVDFFMTSGGVANAAHLGGLVSGLLLALVLRPLPRARFG